MKQILMNTENVKAILDNRKTQTRRVIKPQPVECTSKQVNGICKLCDDKGFYLPDDYVKEHSSYCIGDVLYVRETWRSVEAAINNYSCGEIISSDDLHSGYEYKAGGYYFPDGYEERNDEFSLTDIYSIEQWRPSIHMPKEAARIFLRVTNVRVERLQNITYESAIAEGFEGVICNHDGASIWGCTDCMGSGWLEPPQVDFSFCWNNTIKKSDLDKYGWEANPWVWVIEFERISKEEAYNL